MRKILTVRFCDATDCGEWAIPTLHGESAVRAIGGHDYCAQHWVLPRCVVCNRQLRPYQAAERDWPGTLARASTEPPLCHNDYKAGRSQVPDIDPPPIAQVRTVRRLVSERLDNPDDRLLVLDALGLLGLGGAEE